MRGKRQVGLKPMRPRPINRPHPVKMCWANSNSTGMEIGELSLTPWNYQSKRSHLLILTWRKRIKVKWGSILHQAQRPKELMMLMKLAIIMLFLGQLVPELVWTVFMVQTQTSKTTMIKRNTSEYLRKCKIIKDFSKT